jgi:peptidyl-dipeptidase Dcp
MAPKLAAMSDRITQNAALFSRIEAVYNAPDRLALTPEQQRLTWLYHTNFVRAGARLDAAAQERLSAINQRLASLFTDFNQHVLADETNAMLVLSGDADLSGLPQSVRDAAAAEAAAQGMPGKWVITNTRSAMEPFLTYADRRDLRESGWRMWVGRGDNGDEHDTNAAINEILALRGERAQLPGYPPRSMDLGALDPFKFRDRIGEPQENQRRTHRRVNP